MSKKQKAEKKPKVKPVKCKKCGYTFMPADVPTKKQWTLVSPMPDKDGNVTITIMATWDCPKCGKNITGSMGKTKGDFQGKSKKEQVEELINAKNNFIISEAAEAIGVAEQNLTKILQKYIKDGKVNAKVDHGEFIFL